jgi:hypothetical protein
MFHICFLIEEAKPFKATAHKKQQEADQINEQIKVLKNRKTKKKTIPKSPSKLKRWSSSTKPSPLNFAKRNPKPARSRMRCMI